MKIVLVCGRCGRGLISGAEAVVDRHPTWLVVNRDGSIDAGKESEVCNGRFIACDAEKLTVALEKISQAEAVAHV
jgi:hypothetical protein